MPHLPDLCDRLLAAIALLDTELARIRRMRASPPLPLEGALMVARFGLYHLHARFNQRYAELHGRREVQHRGRRYAVDPTARPKREAADQLRRLTATLEQLPASVDGADLTSAAVLAGLLAGNDHPDRDRILAELLADSEAELALEVTSAAEPLGITVATDAAVRVAIRHVLDVDPCPSEGARP